MPLISLTTAQHSTFLTHFFLRSILPCLPTHSVSETEGKCRDLRLGMQGDVVRNDNLHRVNILFHLWVLEAGALGPEGKGESEEE